LSREIPYIFGHTSAEFSPKKAQDIVDTNFFLLKSSRLVYNRLFC